MLFYLKKYRIKKRNEAIFILNYSIAYLFLHCSDLGQGRERISIRINR